MRIQIKATNMKLTEDLRNYLEKKLETINKYLAADEDPFVSAEIGKTTKHHKSGNVFRAEVKINIKGRDCYAFSEREDLYTAIDEVKEEIVEEIVSSKKKWKSLFKRGGAKIKLLIRKLT